MVYFVYSSETASSNMASSLKDLLCLEEVESFNGFPCFSSSWIKMIEIDTGLIHADFLNGMIDDLVIFLSRHTSGKGIPAFTVHAEGNWNEEVSLGGRPKELSVASPLNMLNTLASLSSINNTGVQVVYEATHHGPFIDKPSFFVELGGNDDAIANMAYAQLIAKAVANSLEAKASYDKVALGVGGLHYAEKFTRLALEGKYAFAHIMPRYQIDNIDMIAKALAKSDAKVELAVIEWKSINADQREIILRELNRLGMDYAKV